MIAMMKKEDPKAKGRSGSKAVIKRNKKGDLEATKKPDFAGVTNETLREDRAAAAGTGNSFFSGAPAPRIKEYDAATQGEVPKGGTKKQVKSSIRRVKKSGASPQAKRAAIRAYSY